MKIRHIFLSLSLLAGLGWAVRESRAELAQEVVVFSVMGDVPYFGGSRERFEGHLADQNEFGADAAFMVHLGDIQENHFCPEANYVYMAEKLKTLSMPTFIIPGDNDWNDCDDPVQGWALFNQYLLRLEQNWPGRPFTIYQDRRPENFSFIQGGVLFIGLHLVNGNIPDRTEWDRRLQDDADWVAQRFAAEKENVRAAVIFAQVGSSQTTSGNFKIFNSQFKAAAQAFGKPILYVNGDGHVWSDNYPWMEPNVRRVQVVEGNIAPPIKVTVGLTGNPLQIFSMNRNPYPNRAPVIRVQHVEPARVVLGTTFYVEAQILDDGLPQPQGTVNKTWTRLSGPVGVLFTNRTGAIRFGNPGNATSSITFSSEGTYVLQLRGHDGTLFTDRHINVEVVSPSLNVPPTVEARAPQSVNVRDRAPLQGDVSDDGDLSALRYLWTMVSGPAPVSFEDPGRVSTFVSFTRPGVYRFRLEVSDEQTTSSDELELTVEAAVSAAGTPASRTMANVLKGETVDLEISLPTAGHLKVVAYSRTGREVAVLVDEDRSAGPQLIRWDGRNKDGVMVPAGVYSVIVNISGQVSKRRVVILN